ncbi:glycoside hydrolase family 6 protein [Granulicella arctica]|uniref:glycoside hydrolase family 6 protein n=1 Tax=Granulicella arctica TaxID=940613 RepID=UPI0021E02568|nr:glycoside hydrolase family 6 protein [Granulicella arctica]
MKRQLFLLLLTCASSHAQVTNVSSTSQTGVDVTHYAAASNYTLYSGNPSEWGNLGQGGYVDFPISSAGGSYALQLYYSNGGSSGAANVYVNGVQQPAALTSGTGGWGTFSLSAATSVTLPVGTSTLRLAATNPVQAFNLAGVLFGPSNPLSKTSFYVSPSSQAAENISQSCSNGASLSTIASQPQGVWFGDWNSNPQADAAYVVKLAQNQGTVPIVVAYDIVNRDCGGGSSGGAANAAAYQAWIQGLALGLGNSKAVVILEPDALSQLNVQGCLSSAQQNERLSLFQYAISMFTQHAPNALVYLDAGHSGAIDVNTMAANLQYAGISNATGFALNVSNYETTGDNTTYGQQISSLVNNKHFIIDTSRNGQGPTADHQFCNPPNRGLGSVSTGFASGVVDADLWVQNPGTSDGTCNGGPPAGTFSLPIACTLIQNAKF